MKINFINLQAQYQRYKNEIDEQIKEVLDSSVYIGGKVGELEKNLAKFSGAKPVRFYSSILLGEVGLPSKNPCAYFMPNFFISARISSELTNSATTL